MRAEGKQSPYLSRPWPVFIGSLVHPGNSDVPQTFERNPFAIGFRKVNGQKGETIREGGVARVDTHEKTLEVGQGHQPSKDHSAISGGVSVALSHSSGG